MSFLKACFGWLISRTAVSFYGVLLLALLIWFVAPLVAFAGWEPFAEENTRIVTILILLASWLGNRIWTFLRSRRTESQMGEALASSSPDETASQEEYEVLQERFRDALKVLKQTKLGGGGGRRLLYQLPWYVIIGPPGAGKTTALKNSGLRFPLMDRFGDAAIRGVGGTRNCDWWFTEEAVLLDTAGRYTTQDSDQMVDSAAWRNFLGLLKRHRRRCPVNGVLVAVGIDDLSRGDKDQIRGHALAVRKRIQELTEDLKLRVPVYVVFTKTDLIAGFTEFFDDLGREARGQVWGMTFPQPRTEDGAQPLKGFSAEFDALVARLHARVFDRLDREGNVQRRGIILGFPDQMAGLKSNLDQFLTDAFGSSRYEDSGLLRGVYFTSGTQEGTPIDRAISAMASAFGLRRQETPTPAGQGRSYFLTKLLRQVIFQEAELVGRTGFLFRHGAWIQRGAYAGGALALAGLLGLWATSFIRNELLIDEVAARVAEIRGLSANPDRGGDERVALPELNALRTLPNGYDRREDPTPILMTFGLYQGDKLGASAQAAYARGLNALLLPRLMRRLETQVVQSAENLDLLYTTLKTYLMLADPSNLDPEIIAFWFATDWQARFPGTANTELRAQLSAHLAALLESDLRPPPINEDLVRKARALIATRPRNEQVFAQIVGSRAARQVAPWRFREKLGPDARVFSIRDGSRFSAGVPGIFTRDGFRQVFLTKGPELARIAASEQWVLGESKNLKEDDLPAFTDEITRLYTEAYIQTWRDFLGSIDLVRFRGFNDAIDVTRTLTGQTSPIASLLTQVSRETNLSITQDLPVDTTALSDRLQDLKDLLGSSAGAAEEAAASVLPSDPTARVTREFARLNALVESPDGQSRPVDQVIGMIDELNIGLATIEASANEADAAKGLLSGSGSEIVRRLRREADRQPEPVNRWLRQLAEQSVAVAAGSVRGRLDLVWREQIAGYCRDSLADRYPLSKASGTDVNMEDFISYFGPGGRSDQFFDQFLSPFVDKSVRPWRARAAGNAQLGISTASLGHLEQADLIRQAYFANGNTQPSIRFTLKPVKLDNAVSQVVLELGDQRLVYRHGPPREISLAWPPPSGRNEARIVFTPLIDARPASQTTEGPWALFRLIDRGRLIAGANPDRFNLVFQVEGLEAVFELRAGSVNNPFRRNLLEGFRCRENF